MGFLKAITTIGSYTALSRVLGFVRDTLMASYLGAGFMSDCFFAAFKLPNFLRRLFAEGALNAAFVPLFTTIYKRDGAAAALASAEQVVSFLVCILVILVGVVDYFSEFVITVTAPGLARNAAELNLATSYLRLVFPYILFVSLSSVLAGVLNSVGRFSVSAFAPSLLNLAMIFGMLCLGPYVPTMGHALSWGVFVSGILQLYLMWWGAGRAGFPLRLRIPRLSNSVRLLLKSMAPGAFGAGVMQVNLLVDLQLASLLPAGSISYLSYADRLNQLPLSLIGVTISTALLPLLSRQIQGDKGDDAMNTQNRVLEYGVLFTLPAAAALIVFAGPLIHGLFCYGSLGMDQSLAISRALCALAMGLPAYVLIKILSTGFFARHDTKTPVKGALLALGTNITLNLILMGPFGHVGIALGTALSSWVNCAFLGYELKKRGYLILDDRFLKRIRPIIMSAMILGFFLWGCDETYTFIQNSYPDLYRFYRLGLLGVFVGSGLMVYGVASYFLKAFDMADLSFLRHKSLSPAPKQ